MAGSEETAAAAVVLVEDHPLYRQALRRLLESTGSFTVVGEYGSAAALRAGRPLRAPALALVDLFLPDTDGVLLIRELRRDFPSIRVLVLTAYIDEWHLERARLAGAAAFIAKTVEPEVIMSTLRSVAAGRTVLPSAHRAFSGTANELPSHGRFSMPTRIFQLSVREREVARLLAAGCTNQEIAQTLYISSGTVKLHVSSIYDKLQVRDRSQAIVYLLEHKARL